MLYFFIKKHIFLSLVCSVPPVGPAFGTVNTSVSEDGAVINWEYFGHHKNVYVEYIVENSKASLCICSHLYYIFFSPKNIHLVCNLQNCC